MPAEPTIPPADGPAAATPAADSPTTPAAGRPIADHPAADHPAADHPAADHPAAIIRDDVAHLAHLARLAVTEQELELFAGQLQVILGSVARVSEVAADDIVPTTHAVPLQNVFRDDVVRPSLELDAVLSGAPSVENERFRVPRILTEEA